MARIIQKQKTSVGMTVYTDEYGKLIGTSHRGAFGQEEMIILHGGENGKPASGNDSWVGCVAFLVCVGAAVVMVLNALH